MIERNVTIIDAEDTPRNIQDILDVVVDGNPSEYRRVDKICKIVAGYWSPDPDKDGTLTWINTPDGILNERAIRDYCKTIDADPSNSYFRFDF